MIPIKSKFVYENDEKITELAKELMIEADGCFLGEGADSQVFLCKMKKNDKKVTLKVLLSSKIDEFINELGILRRLISENPHHQQHPNLPSLIGFTIVGQNNHKIDDGFFAIALNYINGKELHDILNIGVLQNYEAASYIRQVISALIYCHRKSIIHRDLKPENIIVQTNGMIKLIDFGHAICLDQLKQNRFGNELVGSPDYLAPEVAQYMKGRQAIYGFSVDVWAVGILLSECLTRKTPFGPTPYENVEKFMINARKQNFEFESEKLGEASKLVKKILTIDMHERPNLIQIFHDEWFEKMANEFAKFG